MRKRFSQSIQNSLNKYTDKIVIFISKFVSIRNVSFAIIILIGIFIWMYDTYPSILKTSFNIVLITTSTIPKVKHKQQNLTTNYTNAAFTESNKKKHDNKTNDSTILSIHLNNTCLTKSNKRKLMKSERSNFQKSTTFKLDFKKHRNISSIELITDTVKINMINTIKQPVTGNNETRVKELSYDDEIYEDIQYKNNNTDNVNREIIISTTTTLKSAKNFKDKKTYFKSKNRKTKIIKSKGYKFKNSYEEKYRPWLKQVIKQKYVRQSRRNIFFIESSCGTMKLRKTHSSEEGLILNARQSCAIESTARINRKYNIFLFHTCKIDDAFFELSSNYVRELFNYPNIYLVKVNMNQLFNSTPLQDMWNNKAFEGSLYPLEHISDAMRLLILWKYGGTYLDLDVITMRPLTPLKSNFAGVQDDETIANGVLNFEPNGFAHNLLTSCLENFRDLYDGKDWSSNGPILLTNALLEFCQVSEVVQVIKNRCGGFHLYPPSVFYPVHFSDWESFLDEGESQRIIKQIENSTIVHMWNRLSRDGYVLHGSNQAFSLLAGKYCPRVYEEVGPNFRK